MTMVLLLFFSIAKGKKKKENKKKCKVLYLHKILKIKSIQLYEKLKTLS